MCSTSFCVPKQKLSFSTFRTSVCGANRSGRGPHACSTVMLLLTLKPKQRTVTVDMRYLKFSFFPQ